LVDLSSCKFLYKFFLYKTISGYCSHCADIKVSLEKGKEATIFQFSAVSRTPEVRGAARSEPFCSGHGQFENIYLNLDTTHTCTGF